MSWTETLENRSMLTQYVPEALGVGYVKAGMLMFCAVAVNEVMDEVARFAPPASVTRY